MMMDITQFAMKYAFGVLPSNEKIWRPIQSNNLPRLFRAFLWKTLHNTHKVGGYWENVPDWEHQSICEHCEQNAMDSIEHIMLK